jgi:hypothetical protein
LNGFCRRLVFDQRRTITIKPFLYLTKSISLLKKAINSLAALLVTFPAFSQESFVINHDDMPPPKGDVTVRVYQNSRGCAPPPRAISVTKISPCWAKAKVYQFQNTIQVKEI